MRSGKSIFMATLPGMGSALIPGAPSFWCVLSQSKTPAVAAIDRITAARMSHFCLFMPGQGGGGSRNSFPANIRKMMAGTYGSRLMIPRGPP